MFILAQVAENTDESGLVTGLARASGCASGDGAREGGAVDQGLLIDRRGRPSRFRMRLDAGQE